LYEDTLNGSISLGVNSSIEGITLPTEIITRTGHSNLVSDKKNDGIENKARKTYQELKKIQESIIRKIESSCLKGYYM